MVEKLARAALFASLCACEADPPAPTTGRLALTLLPADAEVSVDGAPFTGGELTPGPHQVAVRREGYESAALEVEIVAGQEVARDLTLAPVLHEVSVRTVPEGALVTLSPAGGDPITGPSPLVAQVPTGEVALELTLAGHNPEREAWTVDGPRAVERWLDPEGQVLDLVRIVKTGLLPKQVAFTPDGRELWVTLLNGPTSMFVHDAATGAVTAQPDFGKVGTVELVFSKAGDRVYVTEMETRTAHELDVAKREVLRSFRTGLWPKIVELSPDGGTLYVSNWLGDSITEVDLATGEVGRELSTAKTPRGVYPTKDGATLYVAGFGDGALHRLDLAAGTDDIVFSGGRALRHVVGDEARGVLYVSDMALSVIWVHELATGETRRLAKVDPTPNTIQLTPDGEVLLVSCRGRNAPSGYLGRAAEFGSLMAIDTRSGEILDVAVAGDQPTALALSPDGGTAVLSDLRDDDLRFYRIPDAATLRAGGGGRREVYSLKKP